MKLRNKKTGEIKILRIPYNEYDEDDDKQYSLNLLDYQGNEYNYKSLTELNEEWEDYTPKEPLIKDEKIRKAVRAWAEAVEVNEDKVAFNRYSNGFSYMENKGIFSNISFDGRAFNFEDGKKYTIAELCGEEE